MLNQYRDDFCGYGIDFDISAEAILAVAETASKEGTGARGLLTALEGIFREFKFELPSTAIKRFEVTPSMIENPAGYLEQLKAKNAHLQRDVWIGDIQRFATAFERAHGFSLKFQPSAIDALIAESQQIDRTIQSLCEEKFKDFEHGLKIINRNTEQTVFKIGKLSIADPDKELSKWVVRSIESAKS